MLWKPQTTIDRPHQWQGAGIGVRGLDSFIQGLFQRVWVTMATGEANFVMVPHQGWLGRSRGGKGTWEPWSLRGCLKFSPHRLALDPSRTRRSPNPILTVSLGVKPRRAGEAMGQGASTPTAALCPESQNPLNHVTISRKSWPWLSFLEIGKFHEPGKSADPSLGGPGGEARTA